MTRNTSRDEGMRPTPSKSPLISDLIGQSQAISEVVGTCLQVAQANATVLLLGETGTGKELLARAIHEHSGRPGKFVAINCGAVTESLVESELFGHEKGSFTGATSAKPGLFREANHGTLLLDEIGSLPAHAQHSLLRVLQEGRVRPVGATQEVPVDVRVIAATSVSLAEAMQRGEFRADLFYRLDVIRVVVPPLRNRGEDIVTLFHSFSRRMAQRHGVRPVTTTQAFEEALLRYSWPGNVRQLENLTERLVLTCSGEVLTAAHFDRLLRPTSSGRHAALMPEAEAPSPAPRQQPQEQQPARPDLSVPLKDYLDVKEAEYLEAALQRSGGHVLNAARMAGLSRRTMSRKMKKLGLQRQGSSLEDLDDDLPSTSSEAYFWLCAPPLNPCRLDPLSGELTLGRASSCDFVFPLPGISRVHARLSYRGRHWILEDAGSRNGTRVNGERLQGPVQLEDGDMVEIDSLQFRVVRSTLPPDPHSSTSSHLVRGQLGQVSLQGLLERIYNMRASARIDVASPEGSGHMRIVEGTLLWVSFVQGDKQLVADEALERLNSLSEGLFVVSGSRELHEVRDQLVPLPSHLDLTSSDTRCFGVNRARLLERDGER